MEPSDEKAAKKVNSLGKKLELSMNRLMQSADNSAVASAAMAEVGTAIAQQADKIGAGTGKVVERISAQLAATSLT